MEKFLKVRGQEQPSIETAQSGNFTFFFFPSFNKKENRISDMCQAETPQRKLLNRKIKLRIHKGFWPTVWFQGRAV